MIFTSLEVCWLGDDYDVFIQLLALIIDKKNGAFNFHVFLFSLIS